MEPPGCVLSNWLNKMIYVTPGGSFISLSSHERHKRSHPVKRWMKCSSDQSSSGAAARTFQKNRDSSSESLKNQGLNLAPDLQSSCCGGRTSWFSELERRTLTRLRLKTFYEPAQFLSFRSFNINEHRCTPDFFMRGLCWIETFCKYVWTREMNQTRQQHGEEISGPVVEWPGSAWFHLAQPSSASWSPDSERPAAAGLKCVRRDRDQHTHSHVIYSAERRRSQWKCSDLF